MTTRWFTSLRLWIVFHGVFMILLVLFAADQVRLTCVVCGTSPITGAVWRHPQGYVCDTCVHLATRCALCGLPVRDDQGRIPDGRWLCPLDAANAVLSADEARRIFSDVRGELWHMTQGVLQLRFPEVSVSMYDIDFWNFRDKERLPDKQCRAGFSLSRKSNGQLSHNVLLLSAQRRMDLMAVCAHELMHLWINENKPEAHAIEDDYLEAICELIAYKLMDRKGATETMARIEKNSYTNGKIRLLIGLESLFGINTILEWVKTGSDRILSTDILQSFRPGAPAAAALRSGSIVPSKVAPAKLVPTALRLKGVLGSNTNRVALINDIEFLQNQTHTIRLAQKTVSVTCVELRERSVVVSIDGSPGLKTLYLDSEGLEIP